MPELPDLEVYVEALARHTKGSTLERVRLTSPTLLRSVDPALSHCEGRRVRGVHRLAKRIVIDLDDDLHLVFHLMIAGRLRWRPVGAKPGRRGLATLDFSNGTLLVTEASTKKRATLHLVRGAAELEQHDPGGIEPLETDATRFRDALSRDNHTLKRALTDPHLVAGIGNAYSDEILHRARLSPVTLTSRLDDDAWDTLWRATGEVLREWTARLRAEVGDGFPEKVTAFRSGMAVHGRYREPCPVCAIPVQRIVRAANETNYCPGCQTGGRVLADRALSRLLKKDWPRTLEELEARRPDRVKPER